eukprot:scaffold23876_cov51-Attheya_sp.AAC.2
MAIWTEMIRNEYRFNLEGWSLSKVAMVIFGSGATVGATFDLIFFAQEQANFCVKNKKRPQTAGTAGLQFGPQFVVVPAKCPRDVCTYRIVPFCEGILFPALPPSTGEGELVALEDAMERLLVALVDAAVGMTGEAEFIFARGI